MTLPAFRIPTTHRLPAASCLARPGRRAVIGVGVGAAIIGLAIVGRDRRNEGLDVLVGLFAGLSSAMIGTAIGGVVALTHTDLRVPFDTESRRVLPTF